MKTFDLFPSLVYGICYPKHEDLKKIIMPLLEDASFETNKISDNLFHYKNSKNHSILYEEDFKEFKDWLEDTCYHYVSNVLGYQLDDKIIVTDSWLNKCDKGGYQYPHYHTNSYISGTYYVNFIDGHAPIIFIKDDTSSHVSKQSLTLEKNKTPSRYNTDSVILPEESELYLWQSHLTHGVSDNKLDGRISLSMNFMPTCMTNQRYGYKVYYT
jgi:uncharacterized protein (TIGR02466 family)